MERGITERVLMFVTGVFFLSLVVMFALAFTGSMKPVDPAKAEKIKAEQIARKSNELKVRSLRQLQRLIYFQDPRTGICFADFGYRRGTAALSCEKIPASLLVKIK